MVLRCRCDGFQALGTARMVCSADTRPRMRRRMFHAVTASCAQDEPLVYQLYCCCIPACLVALACPRLLHMCRVTFAYRELASIWLGCWLMMTPHMTDLCAQALYRTSLIFPSTSRACSARGAAPKVSCCCWAKGDWATVSIVGQCSVLAYDLT